MKFFRLFYKTQRFAVAFGVCHAAVAVYGFAQIASFLIAYNGYRSSFYKTYASDKGRIIAEKAVAVQFGKIFKNHIDVIERSGAVTVAGKFNPFPRFSADRAALQFFVYFM